MATDASATAVAASGPRSDASGPGSRVTLVASSGWIGSLLVHLVGLLSLSGIMLSPGADGGSDGVEVALTDLVIDPQIGTGSRELVMPLDQSRLVDLVDVGAEPTLEVAPLTQQETPDTERQFSALLTSEFSADVGLAVVDADWNGVRDPSGGDERESAWFFGLQAIGGRIVYVIDASNSMSGPRLDDARAEASRSIAALSAKQEFYLIFFNTDFRPMPAQQLVRATPANQELHMHWMEQIKGGGQTDPKDAMLVALALAPDVIYFLTDGAFAHDAVDVIRNNNPGRRVKIFTVAYHHPAGLELLQRIADENRGRCVFVPPPPDPTD